MQIQKFNETFHRDLADSIMDHLTMEDTEVGTHMVEDMELVHLKLKPKPKLSHLHYPVA